MSGLRAIAAAIAVVALTASQAAAGGGTGPSIARLAGQEIMTGMAGTMPGPALLARIRAGEVGGIVLFGANIGSTGALARLVAGLQAAAAAGGNPPLLIAVDQEGGAVKRLPDGPPDLSPAAMGLERSARKAGAEGNATAVYLHRLGINVDLAPVLDTPSSPSTWLGTRAFSRDPRTNATLGTAFLEGLQDRGVAATAKHFPGLGTARATTDTSTVVLATPRRALDARLLPFERAIDAQVDLVMVSNAAYTAFDSTDLPAVLSRPIVTGLLRQKLGFRGVVISDAMEAPAPAGHRDAAVAAISAGVDVLLYVDEADSAAAYAEVVSAARSGALPPATLRASAARVEALKRRLARS